MRVLSYFRDGNGASHPNHGMGDAGGASGSWKTRAKTYSVLDHGDFFTGDATMYPQRQVLHNRHVSFGTLPQPNRYSRRDPRIGTRKKG